MTAKALSMRWFVEVSSLGKAEKQTYCVEADSWQRALQGARLQRNDHGPMTGFSIELLDNGFSAIDPMTRQRYSIRKAPPETPLTASTTPAQSEAVPPKSAAPPPSAGGTAAKAAPSTPPSATTSQPPPSSGRSPSRPPAPELKFTPKPPVAKSKPPSAAPPAAILTPLLHAGLEVVAKREQEPDGNTPLTYREYAYYSAADLSGGDVAERLLREQLTLVQRSIASAKAGKLVNLALFDVRFTGRPPVPPLVTLTWKDWKGDPVVSFPRNGPPTTRSAPPPAPLSSPPSAPPRPVSQRPAPLPASLPPQPASLPPQPASVPPQAASVPPQPAAATPLESAPIAATAPIPAPPPAPVAAQASAPPPPPTPPPPAPIPETSPASVGPATTRVSAVPPSAPPVSAPRQRGDELIADLFESMHDLHFLRDSLEGADFCLTLALEKMPARGGIAHLYDIDRREFVITCAGGTGGESLLLRRYAEDDPILSVAMRKRRALVLSDATTSKAVQSLDRYAALGGATSLMVAPVALGGRFLGALELLNPADDVPFTDDDGHALSYIAEQFAEFVASRGIVIDRDSKHPPSGNGSRPR